MVNLLHLMLYKFPKLVILYIEPVYELVIFENYFLKI